MSKVTQMDKVVKQAQAITVMNNQINFLLCELYTIKPDHRIFMDSPSLGEQVKKLSALVAKQVSKSTADATQFAKENPDGNVIQFPKQVNSQGL
jgi:GTPase Era involved in 16S rRNA processing